jgi:DNA-binding response OmpR family regulator
MAEDDRATRESLVRAFELEGFDVQAGGDGALVHEAAVDEFTRRASCSM